MFSLLEVRFRIAYPWEIKNRKKDPLVAIRQDLWEWIKHRKINKSAEFSYFVQNSPNQIFFCNSGYVILWSDHRPMKICGRRRFILKDLYMHWMKIWRNFYWYYFCLRSQLRFFCRLLCDTFLQILYLGWRSFPVTASFGLVFFRWDIV